MANPQCEDGFTKIANEILEALAKNNVYGRGSANGQIIWAVIRKTYGYNKKEDAISISQLIEMTGLSRRTIIYSLQDLEAKRILLINRNHNNSHNEINVIKFNKDYDTWVVQNSAPQVVSNRMRAAKHSAKLREVMQNSAPSAKLTQGVVQNSDNDVRSFAPTKDNITKDNTKEINTLAQKRMSMLSTFDNFWKIYPKKKSKGRAEKAWIKLNPDEQLQDRITNALERAKKSEDWLKNSGQYIPHPATWLNARGWEDEYQTQTQYPLKVVL